MIDLLNTHRFSNDVSALKQHNQVVLFHGKTGRHIMLSHDIFTEIIAWESPLLPPPNLRAVASRLEGLHMLQESSSPNLETLIPAHSGRVLLFPTAKNYGIPKYEKSEKPIPTTSPH